MLDAVKKEKKTMRKITKREENMMKMTKVWSDRH
jgi:hypothetical protein